MVIRRVNCTQFQNNLIQKYTMIVITRKLVSDDQTWNIINADIFENPKI